MQVTTALVPDWLRLVDSFELGLKGLESFQSAIAALEADPVVAPHIGELVGTAVWGRVLEGPDILSRFLEEYLSVEGRLEFHLKTFNAVYRRFETFIHSDTVLLRALAPLYGLYCEAERVTLSPSLAIIQMSNEDRDLYFRHLASGGLMPDLFPLGVERHALEFTWSVGKRVGSPAPSDNAAYWSPKDQFETAIAALRLFKPGAVSVTHMRTKSAIWDWQGFEHGTTMLSQGTPLGSEYDLAATEIDRLVSFWRRFEKNPRRSSRRLGSALRRLGFGLERLRVEDRILDHVIGLEAILLDESEMGELSFRLAMRGAVILGGNPNIREQTFKRLRLAYNLRSRIAHGSSIDSVVSKELPDGNLGQFATDIENDLRRIISRFLAEPSDRNEDQILREIDLRLVRGHMRSTL